MIFVIWWKVFPNYSLLHPWMYESFLLLLPSFPPQLPDFLFFHSLLNCLKLFVDTLNRINNILLLCNHYIFLLSYLFSQIRSYLFFTFHLSFNKMDTTFLTLLFSYSFLHRSPQVLNNLAYSMNTQKNGPYMYK